MRGHLVEPNRVNQRQPGIDQLQVRHGRVVLRQVLGGEQGAAGGRGACGSWELGQ